MVCVFCSGFSLSSWEEGGGEGMGADWNIDWVVGAEISCTEDAAGGGAAAGGGVE